jgi:tetratricopeptide (TPR) repeat protein
MTYRCSLPTRITLFFAVIFRLCAPALLPAQEQARPLAVSAWPGVNLPVGVASRVVGAGLSGDLGLHYRFAALPVFAGIDASYTRAGIDPSGSLWSISGFATVGGRLALAPRLDAAASGFVGLGRATLDTGVASAGQIAIGYGGSVGVEYALGELLAIGLRAGYLAHANTYHGVRVAAGTVVSLPKVEWEARAPREPRVRPTPLETSGSPDGVELVLDDVSFDTIFPVFYKYYDSSPVGRAVLRNGSTAAISDITIKLVVPRYMDVPRTQEVPGSLEPGEEVEIDLYALLTDDVLRVTEGTKSAVSVTVEYALGEDRREYALDQTLEIADRNAMTWDDDRKAGSFVTAKDTAILTMARNVAAVVRGSAFDSINLNVRSAIAMLEALAAYGIQYVVDPTTPYAELSGQPQAVDFLQFPRQTLEYRAGDCDDLSILYAALLEAVGVPTAFITVPGHIFMAFSTGLSGEEAQRVFSRVDELIMVDGVAWVPVETTILHEGFVQAWQSGAKQWREHLIRGQAQMYPVADAWEVYPAVGLPDSPPQIAVPATSVLQEVYRSQLTRFIDREIFPQVSRLQSQIASSGDDPRHINRLGVLYARYGLSDRARREFERVTTGSRPYAPALVNLGHLHFLAKEVEQALAYYERAEQLQPENPAVLLAVARAQHELENYGLVSRTYSRLKSLDPDLAAQFAYLDFRGETARRAAQVSDMASRVIWDEE